MRKNRIVYSTLIMTIILLSTFSYAKFNPLADQNDNDVTTNSLVGVEENYSLEFGEKYLDVYTTSTISNPNNNLIVYSGFSDNPGEEDLPLVDIREIEHNTEDSIEVYSVYSSDFVKNGKYTIEINTNGYYERMNYEIKNDDPLSFEFDWTVLDSGKESVNYSFTYKQGEPLGGQINSVDISLYNKDKTTLISEQSKDITNDAGTHSGDFDFGDGVRDETDYLVLMEIDGETDFADPIELEQERFISTTDYDSHSVELDLETTIDTLKYTVDLSDSTDDNGEKLSDFNIKVYEDNQSGKLVHDFSYEPETPVDSFTNTLVREDEDGPIIDDTVYYVNLTYSVTKYSDSPSETTVENSINDTIRTKTYEDSEVELGVEANGNNAFDINIDFVQANQYGNVISEIRTVVTDDSNDVVAEFDENLTPTTESNSFEYNISNLVDGSTYDIEVEYDIEKLGASVKTETIKESITLGYNLPEVFRFDIKNSGSINIVNMVINEGSYLISENKNISISFLDEKDNSQNVMYKIKDDQAIDDYQNKNTHIIDSSTLVEAPEYENPTNGIHQTYTIPEIRFSVFDTSSPIKMVLKVEGEVIYENTITTNIGDQFTINSNSFEFQKRINYSDNSKIEKLSFKSSGTIPNEFDPQKDIVISEVNKYTEKATDIKVVDREDLETNGIFAEEEIELNSIYIEIPNNLVSKNENKLTYLVDRMIFNTSVSSSDLNDYEELLATGVVVSSYRYVLPMRYWLTPTLIGLAATIIILLMFIFIRRKMKINVVMNNIDEKVDSLLTTLKPHYVTKPHYDYLELSKLSKTEIKEQLYGLEIEFDDTQSKENLIKLLSPLKDEEIKKTKSVITDDFFSVKSDVIEEVGDDNE